MVEAWWPMLLIAAVSVVALNGLIGSKRLEEKTLAWARTTRFAEWIKKRRWLGVLTWVLVCWGFVLLFRLAMMLKEMVF